MKECAMLCRSVLVVSALSVFACGHVFAAGSEYVDRNNQFKVSVPDGWTKTIPETSEKVDAVLRSPRYEVSKGVCPLAADPFPATRGMSQKQINDEMEPHINAAFWQGALSMAGAQVLVDDAGSELRKGKRFYTATMRVTGKVDGVDRTAKMKATLQVAPDQIAMATCAAWVEHVAGEEADMAIVLDSFEGLGAQVVAQNPAAPSAGTLLLFAGPRFDGPRKALTQDIPNLFQAGWAVPTASFALQGYGLWEVCDGMNYAGNCRVLSGAASTAGGPNDRPLRIGSARRVALPKDPRNAIGLLASGVATQASESLRQLSSGRRR
jgi:hypothetical protein